MRFWLSASLVALVFEGPFVAARENKPKRANEITLAGLRPGKANLEGTYREFPKEAADHYFPDTPNSTSWYEPCNWQEMTVQFDSNGLVQSVTVSQVGERGILHCNEQAGTRHSRSRLGTGHGLLLKDRCERVQEIYGKPQSESPSENGSEAVESLSYSFDWAGPKVPQTMTVLCSAAPLFQVVKITLATSNH